MFVLSSHSEGMSNTILEAMASGLPVIATAVGSNPELVADGETGFLVPADDPETLSLRLTRLSEDLPLRREMGIRGRSRIERDFSIARMVEDYSNLYRQKIQAIMPTIVNQRSAECGNTADRKEVVA